MASKNMRKLKRKLAQSPNDPNVTELDFPRNYLKLFLKDIFKENAKGWPSHFTTKRVK